MRLGLFFGVVCLWVAGCSAEGGGGDESVASSSESALDVRKLCKGRELNVPFCNGNMVFTCTAYSGNRAAGNGTDCGSVSPAMICGERFGRVRCINPPGREPDPLCGGPRQDWETKCTSDGRVGVTCDAEGNLQRRVDCAEGETCELQDDYYLGRQITCVSQSRPDPYQGCYTDEPNRALGYQPEGSFGIKACIDRCRSEGFAYAGLQYGGECYCGDALGYARVDDGECDSPCVDGGGTCGGSWRNSVYATGKAN